MMEGQRGGGGGPVAWGKGTNTTSFSSHKILSTFELDFSL